MFFTNSKLKKGDVFAVQTGDFAGQMFYFMEQNENDYIFFTTPLIEILKVPIDKFDFAKEHGIIEYVENLPRKIFKVVKRQYEILKKSKN